jgi:hypothetical protein
MMQQIFIRMMGTDTVLLRYRLTCPTGLTGLTGRTTPVTRGIVMQKSRHPGGQPGLTAAESQRMF